MCLLSRVMYNIYKPPLQLMPILSTMRVIIVLTVPMREIFDRSDFPDFYTIKSLRVGNFGVKIKKIFKNI